MAFNQEVIDLLNKETMEKLSEITRIRQTAGNANVGLLPQYDEGDIASEEGLTNLLRWNMAPMEAIAAVAHDELERGNVVTADILMNDLRTKMKRLIDTVEGWLNCELEETRLKSIEQKEASEIPTTDTPEAKERP
jgi:hypothetical protein